MSQHSFNIHCSKCGHDNPDDARFCQQCGNTLLAEARKCKRCGTDNDLKSEFCKKCGSHLSNASLGITAERAEEWWYFLIQEYAFYAQFWSEKGVANRLYNQCKTINESLSIAKKRGIPLEVTAIAIPIATSDWCIKLLEWKQLRIRNGMLYSRESCLRIIDLEGKSGETILYEEIASFRFEGWTMLFCLKDNSVIKLHIKEPGTALVTFFAAANLLGSLSDQTSADREASFQSTKREIDDLNNRRTVGARFWKTISDFFSEILSHE